jgi:hypothetical protein
MASIALLLTKMLFLSQIRPKNSVSDRWNETKYPLKGLHYERSDELRRDA